MEKMWLVRTTNLQLLGPFKRSELIDIVNSKQLDSEDEICSGNGYWFKLCEENLLQKYLFDGTAQGFNPVSEAESVLSSEFDEDATSVNSNFKIPDINNNDNLKEGIKVDVDDIEEECRDKIPMSEDLEYPEIVENHQTPLKVEEPQADLKLEKNNETSKNELSEKKKELLVNIKKSAENTNDNKSHTPHFSLIEKKRNDRYLIVILVFLVLAIIVIFLFSESKFLSKIVNNITFIEKAYSQTTLKKKIFF